MPHTVWRQYTCWSAMMLFRFPLLYRHFDNINNALKYRNNQPRHLVWLRHVTSGCTLIHHSKNLAGVQRGSTCHPTNATNTGYFPAGILRRTPEADQKPLSNSQITNAWSHTFALKLLLYCRTGWDLKVANQHRIYIWHIKTQMATCNNARSWCLQWSILYVNPI